MVITRSTLRSSALPCATMQGLTARCSRRSTWIGMACSMQSLSAHLKRCRSPPMGRPSHTSWSAASSGRRPRPRLQQNADREFAPHDAGPQAAAPARLPQAGVLGLSEGGGKQRAVVRRADLCAGRLGHSHRGGEADAADADRSEGGGNAHLRGEAAAQDARVVRGLSRQATTGGGQGDRVSRHAGLGGGGRAGRRLHGSVQGEEREDAVARHARHAHPRAYCQRGAAPPRPARLLALGLLCRVH